MNSMFVFSPSTSSCVGWRGAWKGGQGLYVSVYSIIFDYSALPFHGPKISFSYTFRVFVCCFLFYFQGLVCLEYSRVISLARRGLHLWSGGRERRANQTFCHS